MSRPFVVVVGEDELRDALAGCGDLEVFPRAFHDYATFFDAVATEIPSEIDTSVVVLSDQVPDTASVSFEAALNALRGVAMAVCWRKDPYAVSAIAPTVRPPVTLGLLRQGIAAVTGISLEAGDDTPIHVAGLQETGSAPAGGRTFGQAVAGLASLVQTIPPPPATPPPPAAFPQSPPPSAPPVPPPPTPAGDAVSRLEQLVGPVGSPPPAPAGWTQPQVEPPPQEWDADPLQIQAPLAAPAADQMPGGPPFDLATAPPPPPPPATGAAAGVLGGVPPPGAVGQPPPPGFPGGQPPVFGSTQGSPGLVFANPAAAAGPRHVCQVCSVWATTGGVGKTMTAMNLAARVATATGLRVLLVDLDVSSGDVGARLWIKASEAVTITDLMREAQLTPERLAQVLPQHTQTKVHLLLAPYTAGQAINTSSVAAYERVLRVATQLFDMIVLDCPAGNDDVVTRFALPQSTAVCVVTDNETSTLAGMRRWLRYVTDEAKIIPRERLGVFVNQRVDGDGGHSLDDIKKHLNPLPILATLPDDRRSILRTQQHGRVTVLDRGDAGVAVRQAMDRLILGLCPAIGSLLPQEAEMPHQTGQRIRVGSSSVVDTLRRLFTKS